MTRKRNGKDKCTTEVQYYLTSCNDSEEVMASIIRGHWEIENCVHYVLDVTMREDESRIRREFASENMASLRRFVMNLMRLHPQKGSMKGKIQDDGWNDSFREDLLFG